jgi:hypothetical protein
MTAVNTLQEYMVLLAVAVASDNLTAAAVVEVVVVD